jgi:hypothetical protein
MYMFSEGVTSELNSHLYLTMQRESGQPQCRMQPLKVPTCWRQCLENCYLYKPGRKSCRWPLPNFESCCSPRSTDVAQNDSSHHVPFPLNGSFANGCLLVFVVFVTIISMCLLSEWTSGKIRYFHCRYNQLYNCHATRLETVGEPDVSYISSLK